MYQKWNNVSVMDNVPLVDPDFCAFKIIIWLNNGNSLSEKCCGLNEDKLKASDEN